MRLLFTCFLFLLVSNAFSQDAVPTEKAPTAKIDSLYREDQFYFGFTLNTLQNKPNGLTQDKFSSGISMGFLRDMPINKYRTVAIAAGIGFAYNNYNQNLAITKLNQIPIYTVLDSKAIYNKNKFSQLLVEVPIEFRWRTSTFESYKFWRIYSGFKFSYLVYDKSVFDDAQGKIIISGNKDFNNVLYGAYISAGYNTINVYAYYGLNKLFRSSKIGNESINMNSMNIGIMFYIL